MDSYIRYGSLITISTKQDFFLFSQCLANSIPYLSRIDNDSTDTIAAIYKVHPKSNNSVQSQILKYTNSIKQEDFYNKINHIKRLESNLEGEIKANNYSQNSLNGKIITYGSIVQFEHLKSHKYLTLQTTHKADSDRSNFKISFEDFPNENSHFCILPCFSYQNSGNRNIRVNDKVYLQNFISRLRKLAWLHCSTESFIDLSYTNFSLKKNFDQQKGIEVNCSLDQKTQWKIGIYDEFPNKNVLSCGSFYWFSFCEFQFCLSIKNENFESNKHRFDLATKKDINALWLIESENPLEGGKVVNENLYRLKNLMTGKYLAYRKHLKLKTKNSSSTLWQLFINNSMNCIVYLMHVNTHKFLGLNNENQLVFEFDNNESYLFKAEKAKSKTLGEAFFIQETKYILLRFIHKLNEKKSKFLAQISERDSKMLLVCLKNLKKFCMNKLQGMIEIEILYGKADCSRPKLLKNHYFFETLALVLNNCITPSIKKTLNDIKEKNFEIMDSEKKFYISTIKKIGKSIYKCLVKLCHKNRKNQVYCLNFVKLFIEHIGLGLGASKIILNICKNIRIQVSNSLDLIEMYAAMIEKERSKQVEYLSFFSSVCVSKGEANTINQEKIFNLLFKNKELSKNVLIRTETIGKCLYLILNNNKVSVESCFKNKVLIDFAEEIETFVQFIGLYSNLSYGRHHECTSLFVSEYSFHVLDQIIWNDELFVDIRAAFAKFLLVLYIDCHPREESKKPDLLKINLVEDEVFDFSYKIYEPKGVLHHNWSNFTDEYDFTPFYESLECLPSFIRKLLSYFDAYSSNKSNSLTKKLLKIMEKLLKYQLISQNSYFSDNEPAKDLDIVTAAKSIFLVIQNVTERKTVPELSVETLTYSKRIQKPSEKELSMPSVEYSTNDDYEGYSWQKLKSYLHAFNQNLLNSSKLTLDHRIKIKVCRILEYFLDSRQEYFLSNFFEWFCIQEENFAFDLNSICQLLPRILNYDIYKFIEEDFNQIIKPFIPDINSISQHPVIPVLLSNFVNSNNWKVQSSFLTLIIRCYSQRTEMLKSVKKLHSLWIKDEISLLNWIKCDIQSFKHYTELWEIWMCYWNNNKNEGKNKETIEKIKRIILNIETFLYSDCVLTENGPVSLGKTAISSSRQDILYQLGFSVLMVSFIKKGIHKLALTYDPLSYNSLSEPRQRLSQLFSNCFSVLKKLVTKNQKNQRRLFKSMNAFTISLHLNLGQIPLICSILKNNQSLIETLDFEFLKTFSDLIEKHGRQQQFLKVWNTVQIVNEKPVERLQKIVLSFFIKEKINSELLFVNKSNDSEFSFEPERIESAVEKDEPFIYHSAVLYVLSKTVYKVSKRFINESKCQKLFSIDYIFKVLFLCENLENCKNMKIPMLWFVFNAYFYHDVFYSELKSHYMLIDYIYFQSNKLHQSSIFDQYELDCLAIFVKILNKYRINYIKKIAVSYYEQADIKALKYFSKAIYKNSHKFRQTKLSIKLIKTINQLLSNFNLKFKIPDDSKFENDQYEDFADIISKTSENIDSLATNQKAVQWQDLKDLVLYSDVIHAQLQDENIAFALILYQSHNFELGISFESIMRSLISFMYLSKSHKISKFCYSFIIKTFRTILSDSFLLKCKAKNTSSFKTKLQNELNYYDLPNLVITLLNQENLPLSLFKGLISLGIELLKGPNINTQNKFFHSFLSQNSEIILKKINDCFENEINDIDNYKQPKVDKKLVFKDKIDIIDILLQFIQLLCLSFNKKMQNFFRFQPNSKTSYNILAIILKMLNVFLEKKYFFTFPHILKTFDTIIALIQGPCIENQDLVIDSEFLITTKRLLYNKKQSTRNTSSENTHEKIKLLTYEMCEILKNKSLIIILNFFEGRADYSMGTKVIRVIGIEILKENLNSVYSQFLVQHSLDEECLFSQNFEFFPSDAKPFKDFLENGIFICQLFLILLDSKDPEILNLLSQKLPLKFIKSVVPLSESKFFNFHKDDPITANKNKDKTFKSLNFFYQLIGKVEIVSEKKTFKKYFRYPCQYKSLTEEMKANFHLCAKRETEKSKLKYLLEKIPSLITKMTHASKLNRIVRKRRILWFIKSNIKVLSWLVFVLCLALNFVTLMSFADDKDYPSFLNIHLDTTGIGKQETMMIFVVLGTVQVILSSFIWVFFLIQQGPIILYKAQKDFDMPEKLKSIKPVVKAIRTGFLIIFNWILIYHTFYLISSVVGLVVHPFYYSIQLLDIFYRFSTLKHIANTFIVSAKPLVLWQLLFGVIVYYYAILGYSQLYNDYADTSNSLLRNFLVVWDETFKKNGGIGAFLPYPATADSSFGRFCYDNSYNIIQVVLMMGILEGIIVDTFAKLRAKQKFSRVDRQNKCFVCGMTKAMIEQNNETTFVFHVEKEHNEWNYVFFIWYLIQKEKNSLSALESYVLKLFEHNDFYWFPNEATIKSTKINRNNEKIIKNVNIRIESIEKELKKLKLSLNS